jgi:hypothetical protein
VAVNAGIRVRTESLAHFRYPCAAIPNTIWAHRREDQNRHEKALLNIVYRMGLHFHIHLHPDRGMYRLQQAAAVSFRGER